MFVWEGAVPRDLFEGAVKPIQRLLVGLPGSWGAAIGRESDGAAANGAVRGCCGSVAPGSSAGARQLKQALRQAQQTDGAVFWRSQLISTAGTLVQVSLGRC